MSEFMTKREQKIRQMSEFLVRMDKGEVTSQQIKENFRDILKDINPAEIALIENALITKEGFPAEKIYKLCDVHIDIFRESLEKESRNFKTTKPLNVIIEEHNEILKFLGELKEIASKLKKGESFYQNISKLRAQFRLLQGLENHEIVQPPKILWMEHDSLRERIKELGKILENSDDELLKYDFDNNLYPLILYIVDIKTNHVYKENNILFPTAMQKLNAEEWGKVLHSMNDIGYADLIYIRYFAVRDNAENYLGTLEITQDVTEIKRLEGEKRIYSEELS